MGGPDAAERLSRDTISNADSLAVPRKRHNAHDGRLPKQNVAGSIPVSRSNALQ